MYSSFSGMINVTSLPFPQKKGEILCPHFSEQNIQQGWQAILISNLVAFCQQSATADSLNKDAQAQS